MKLRIQGNSIRLRLTQPEVQDIGQQNTVSESLLLDVGNSPLEYSLTMHSGGGAIEVTFRNGKLVVSLPSEVAMTWATTEQVGIEANLPLGNEQTLHVLIEKDFQCLHRDEPDHFPNPAATAAP